MRGFSARELSKLALAWRAAAFATEERVDSILGRGDAELAARPATRPRVVARAVYQAEARARRARVQRRGGYAAQWLFNLDIYRYAGSGCRVKVSVWYLIPRW